MIRYLEIIAERRWVGLYDGWQNRYFASTHTGDRGWYFCIRARKLESETPSSPITPPPSRRTRPHPLYWRRGEVIAYFQKLLRRASTIGRERQAREWKKTAFGR